MASILGREKCSIRVRQLSPCKWYARSILVVAAMDREMRKVERGSALPENAGKPGLTNRTKRSPIP